MPTLNQNVFLWLHAPAGQYPLLDVLAVFFGSWLPYFLVIAFIFLAIRQGDVRRRFFLFAEGALAIILSRGIITTTIHYFYNHPRPFLVYNFAPLITESGASFPSGHAAWFFALAMTVWYIDKKWGTWFFIFASLMGIARIYAGVHWPLDILGGAAIGIFSGGAVHRWLGDVREKIVIK